MIIRAKKQRRFTTVDNAPFCDQRLRWETRGLLAYLLTKPDGWEIRIEDLLKQEQPEDGGRATGREKIFRMLRQLRQYGYLYRTQVNGADGRFETVCEVYENPADNPHFLAEGEDAQPQPFPEFGEDDPNEGQRTAVGNGDHGRTVVGNAAHGKAVHGTPARGCAVNGNGDRIVKTDQIKDGEESKDLQRGKTEKSTPPHLRGWDALHQNGLTPEQQQLMNSIRSAFNFRKAEDALDATHDLLGAGLTEWGEEEQLLLETLRRVAKGVVPATLFSDWLAVWKQEATADELDRLFGNNRETSWWINASGLRGMPWPSQVASNLALARDWELTPADRMAGRTAAQGTTQAGSSLMEFAAQMQGMRGNGQ